jgi:hypothetical protein
MECLTGVPTSYDGHAPGRTNRFITASPAMYAGARECPSGGRSLEIRRSVGDNDTASLRLRAEGSRAGFDLHM